MKRKIRFHISIGNYEWPEKSYAGQMTFPILDSNSRLTHKTIEFEWDEKEDVLTVANRELKKELGDVKYLVWYWTWLE